MVVKNFEELEIWKEARRLTCEIYDLSKTPKFSKDVGLRNQMQRTAVSIMSNVAEGFERGGTKNLSNFSTLQKVPVVSFGLNSVWRWIKITSIKR